MVDSGTKQVSSSAGHELMNGHLFKDARIAQASMDLQELIKAMMIGDHTRFFELVEREALSLHAMMMTSDPSYILLHPNSLEIVKKIQAFRQQTGLAVGFTIDAGPNIHLLYFGYDKSKVHAFIESELINLIEDGKWLDDRIGDGPIKL